MSEYANPDALVETGWLAERLEDPAIRIVEVDEDVTAYEKGHIPGAVRWNWFGDLHDPLRRDFIDQAGLARLLGESGVGPNTTVILYGGNNNWFASYAYWLLRYLGFDRVKLLNGGRQKWELESRELSAEAPGMSPVNVEIDRGFAVSFERSGTRSWAVSTGPASSTSAPPRNTEGTGWPPTTFPRSRPRFPGTSPVRSTSPGRRRPTRTGRSDPPRSYGSSTAISIRPRRSSHTAASESAPATPGSSSASCSAIRTPRTTTAPGPSTARWWVRRWGGDRAGRVG